MQKRHSKYIKTCNANMKSKKLDCDQEVPNKFYRLEYMVDIKRSTFPYFAWSVERFITINSFSRCPLSPIPFYAMMLMPLREVWHVSFRCLLCFGIFFMSRTFVLRDKRTSRYKCLCYVGMNCWCRDWKPQCTLFDKGNDILEVLDCHAVKISGKVPALSLFSSCFFYSLSM